MSWDRGYDNYYSGGGGYGRGGGGRGGRRRNYRDDYNRREALPESPTEKLRNTIIKFGEVDPPQELSKIEASVRELKPFNSTNLAEAVRIALTEQPFKIPHYASLLRLLCNPAPSETDNAPPGRLILDDFFKGFQGYLDKHSWRETRLCVHFYAHLTCAGVISTASFVSMLQAFTAVLEEFDVSFTRAKEAAFCAAEGFMIGGLRLEPSVGSEILSSIRTYTETLRGTKALVKPISVLHEVENLEHAIEGFDAVLAVLDALAKAPSWPSENEAFPRPYLDLDSLPGSFVQYDLPMILVPPELIELDGGFTEGKTVCKGAFPEWFLRIFPNDVTPPLDTPPGYAIRSCLMDTIHIFEINRKECGRILLEFPKWTVPGTFRPKPGSAPVEGTEGKPGWQVENTAIETILVMLMVLPSPARQLKMIYYSALITEIAKMSPSTVGPAVGKSIRALYSFLGGGGLTGKTIEEGGLDVELSRRFADWFAIHMSNFNFGWVWKEWIPDIPLPITHPKRRFVRQAVELEIRLAYHDRVKKTLPTEMQQPDAEVISEEAPVPSSEFEDSGHPHADSFNTLLNLFKGKSSVNDIYVNLETLKSTLLDSSPHLSDADVNKMLRKMTVQCILNQGARSFSHFLNYIERYLALFHYLTTGEPPTSEPSSSVQQKKEYKAAVLEAVTDFWWKANTQMVGIVFDKLMQYKVVDASDVVEYVFAFSTPTGMGPGSEYPEMDARKWDLLEGALDKAIGRVANAENKLMTLRKEEDEKRALAKAKASGDNMAVDTEENNDAAVDANPELKAADHTFSALKTRERDALASAMEGFIGILTSPAHNPFAAQVITQAAWADRAKWTADEWSAWESWGWWRHFCRTYAPSLKNYYNTFEAVSFARFEGSVDPSILLFKQIWNVATGQQN